MSKKSKGPAATGPQPITELTSNATVAALPDGDKIEVAEWREKTVLRAVPIGNGEYEAVEVPDTAEPEQVPTTNPLDATRAFVRRYVVLSDEQADAIALLVLHTHAYEALGITPYLVITSPEKRSGKTRLLEVLRLLVREPLLSGSISAASLARIVDAKHPTLLLDESDATFSGNSEWAEALRGVLNDGYYAGGSYVRCDGPHNNVKTFSTFCPKVIAGIEGLKGRLPETVTDRGIRIRMHRKTAGEPVERFRRRDVGPEAEELKANIDKWAAYSKDHLATWYVEEIPELDDRAFDIWEPLLAIAERVGGDWPDRARQAALALSGQRDTEDGSVGIQLLADIRQVFENYGDRISTADLRAALIALEDSPWGDWRAGKPITPQAFSRMVRNLDGPKVGPVKVDGVKVNGYKREQFEWLFERYLSPSGTSGTSGTSGSTSQAGSTTGTTGTTQVPGGLFFTETSAAEWAEHVNGYRLCEVHGKTSVQKEAHGLTYLACGCHEAVSA
jgi:Protein of unknown function (DUF3631)